jgi:hypothetical protein
MPPRMLRDGASNFTEYVAGTDPQSAASAPRLTLGKLASGSLELRISTVAGRRYRFERRNALGSGLWMAASDELVGDGTDVALSIPAPTGSAEFYRVSISR